MRAARALLPLFGLLAAPLAAAEPTPFVVVMEEDGDEFTWVAAGVADGDATLVDARHEVGLRYLDGSARNETSTDTDDERRSRTESWWSWGHESWQWSGASVAGERVGLASSCADQWEDHSEQETSWSGYGHPYGYYNESSRSTRDERHTCTQSVEAAGAPIGYRQGCRSRDEYSFTSAGDSSYEERTSWQDRQTHSHESACGTELVADDKAPLLVGRECASSYEWRSANGYGMATTSGRCDEGVFVGAGDAGRVMLGRRHASTGACDGAGECVESTSARDGAFLTLAGDEHDVSTDLGAHVLPGSIPSA